ncbi:hypothetical protein LEP1GSC170_5091 [Leptospira interrogans serovar Bataviae str. HAI135]|nr:hypothetical protein LEP1GSC170_5091 [Leptospira interrogans serovar Bataviae str. HAI135]
MTLKSEISSLYSLPGTGEAEPEIGSEFPKPRESTDVGSTGGDSG